MSKITDAYNAGQHGKELSSDEKHGRLRRIAHRLGKKSGEAMDAADAAYERQQAAKLNEAIELAQGPNKIALEIIKAAAAIPDQRKSRPAGYTKSIDPKNDKTLAYEWNIALADSTHAEKDPSRPGATVLVGSLGRLKMTEMELDESDWLSKLILGKTGLSSMAMVSPEHVEEAVSVPVDGVSLHVVAEVHDDVMLRPQTTIWVNSRPYHVDKRDYQQTYSEGARVDIGPDGRVSELTVSYPGVSGKVAIDASKATVEAGVMLDGVLLAVQETATMYQQVQEIN